MPISILVNSSLSLLHFIRVTRCCRDTTGKPAAAGKQFQKKAKGLWRRAIMKPTAKQLFECNCIQSLYWRQFTTTIHSPIGMNPQDFEINITGPDFEDFAQNDLWLEDPQGADHPKYTK